MIEIGGAYAHIFFDLLKFLEIRTLVITDIDAVKLNDSARYVKCQVRHGERTSNACLKAWFKADVTLEELLAATDESKIDVNRRVAFQLPPWIG